MGRLQISVYGAIALLSTYCLYSRVSRLIAKSKIRKAYGCLPPKQYPQADRILGLDLFLQRLKDGKSNNLLPRSIERFKEAGSTFSFRLMGKTVFATIDPENVKAILATQFEDFDLGQRLAIWAPLAGAGIFTTDGAQWMHSREMVRPNFSRAQVVDLDSFEGYIQNLIAAIPVGEMVDLQPLFFRLTLDSATEFLLGESVHSLSSGQLPPEKDFGYQFDYAQTGLGTRTRLGPFYWIHCDAKFCHDLVDQFVHKSIEKRYSEVVYMKGSGAALGSDKKQGQYVFINELAKQTNDPITLRNEAMNILIAGRDTTASLLSNLFVMLAKHPHVWAKLRNEVLELNGRIPDYETLRGMRYLKFVLNEALRLYPSVPANYREANKPTTLPHGGGADGLSPIFIPSGTIVSYTVFAMHRRRDIYGPDADDFCPERWEKLRPGWGYLPFNGGPRICVGQQFALTEAGYATVRLMQTFSGMEDREPRAWGAKQHLTMSSLWGTKVALTRG